MTKKPTADILNSLEKVYNEEIKILVEKEAFRTAEFLNSLEKVYVEYKMILNFDGYKLEEDDTGYLLSLGRPQLHYMPPNVIKRLFKMVNKQFINEAKETVDEIKETVDEIKK